MATSYLTKVFGGDSNLDKWTLSMWVKRGTVDSTVAIYGTYINGSNYELITFTSGGVLYWENYQSSSMKSKLETKRLFRDPAAWYHLVFVWDSANASAGDRARIYVNGVEETEWETDTQPSSGQDSLIGNTYTQQIGANGSGNNDYDGCMSHIHFCDGYAYAASDFGSFDSTSGIWKINTGPSVSYGTNGYFILNNSASVTDDSPNSNNWTIYEYITSTKDSPSNNFATLNVLDRHIRDTNNSGDFVQGKNGNLTLDSSSGMWAAVRSTLGVTAGKWYWELKRVSGTADLTGICYGNWFWNATGNQPWDNAYYQCADFSVNGGTGYYSWSGRSGDSSWLSSVTATTGDILGYALDMDNSALYVHHNGTYFDGVGGTPGVPTSGATKTGDMLGLLDATNGVKYVNYGQEVFPVFADVETSNTAKIEVNFGNGYFGQTQITSAGTNAGEGLFEYDVPTGYYALCTKNLKLQGG